MLRLASVIVLVGIAAAQRGVGSGLQKVAVQGSFFCGDQIARNVSIELWDFDTKVRGDLMGKAKTDGEGHFAVEGLAQDFGDEYIEPEIRIYHECNDYRNQGIKGTGICAREWVFHIPRNYINKEPKRLTTPVFRIGQINLELIQPKESHACPDEHHA